jgi:hypothetical protein
MLGEGTNTRADELMVAYNLNNVAALRHRRSDLAGLRRDWIKAKGWLHPELPAILQ